MPISETHREVFLLLARNRNPDSYVAGGTLSNINGIRLSEDIDLFHSTPDATLSSFEIDRECLEGSGFRVEPLIRPRPGFVRASVTSPDGHWLKMDWAHESSWRFFPILEDSLFGYCLHWFDAATNKVLAAASRSEARDGVDLLYWHRNPVSLGALIWAAVGKDPGFSPDLMLDEIIRNARINPRDIASLAMSEDVDPHDLRQRFHIACDDARALFRVLPIDTLGHVFLDQHGGVIEPDVDDPETLARLHTGSEFGAWPEVIDEGPAPSFQS